MTLIIAINSLFDNEAPPPPSSALPRPFHQAAGNLRNSKETWCWTLNLIDSRGSIESGGERKIFETLETGRLFTRIEDNLIGKLFFYGKRVNAR